jgi:hypothetical protein
MYVEPKEQEKMNGATLYQLSKDDLDNILAKQNIEFAKRELLSRFRDTIVGIKTVAEIHKVSEKTVRNYINDGFIQPLQRDTLNSPMKFRLSKVLEFDFIEFKKQKYGSIRKG